MNTAGRMRIKNTTKLAKITATYPEGDQPSAQRIYNKRQPKGTTITS
jgi:hypothetical protein